ncbi:duf636 domain protein [Colletotrichum musicola]|uniref:Duf636 domain protein n=1 Tax=Colletotrichum musicola TaxID=2175873 RepID=A0A8H6NAB2_9PEZI|nr:duf636 domain protein [Colletotrichum musicola]
MLHVSCLCGAVSQDVAARIPESGDVKLTLGHSDVERHSSGITCVSYYPILPPQFEKGTSKHVGADGWTRYFCSTCGCHVFRGCAGDRKHDWEAATGVANDDDMEDGARYVRHSSVSDTKDGGISIWLSDIDGQTLKVDHGPERSGQDKERAPPSPSDTLPASCACGTVSFHITRPDVASHAPHSGYPDLQYAACQHSADFMSNPRDEKWWIRGDSGEKYLAGTCACRSCRLASGFEIQTWVFVPRSNIFIHLPATDGRQTVPTLLEFTTLPPGILKTYRSSPGVMREFCGVCGATVFWHDESRPGVVDVSAGLLRAPEGARAGTWLDWWTARCSYAEEADRGRTGVAARVARTLVEGLERGLLRSSKGQE